MSSEGFKYCPECGGSYEEGRQGLSFFAGKCHYICGNEHRWENPVLVRRTMQEAYDKLQLRYERTKYKLRKAERDDLKRQLDAARKEKKDSRDSRDSSSD